MRTVSSNGSLLLATIFGGIGEENPGNWFKDRIANLGSWSVKPPSSPPKHALLPHQPISGPGAPLGYRGG